MRILGIVAAVMGIVPTSAFSLSDLQIPQPAQPVEEAVRIVRNYMVNPFDQYIWGITNRITDTNRLASLRKIVAKVPRPAMSEEQRQFNSEFVFVAITYEQPDTFRKRFPTEAKVFAKGVLDDEDWTWFVIVRHPNLSDREEFIRIMRDGRLVVLWSKR